MKCEKKEIIKNKQKEMDGFLSLLELNKCAICNLTTVVNRTTRDIERSIKQQEEILSNFDTTQQKFS